MATAPQAGAAPVPARDAAGPGGGALPPDEQRRLQLLQEYGVLDTLPEPAYQALVRLAAAICGTPVGLVSLVDCDRQWFKARVGTELEQTPRETSFCATALHRPDALLVVPDAHADPRFRDLELVTGPVGVRFYAGAPLVTREGTALGTLCVLDTVPRELDDAQRAALRDLAEQCMALLDAHRTAGQLARALVERDAAEVRAQAADEQLAGFFEHATTPMLVARLDGTVVEANPALAALLACAPQSLAGSSLAALTGRSGEPEEVLRRLLEGAEQQAVRETVLRHGGVEVLVLLTTTLVRGAHGSPRAQLLQCEPVGARRSAEELLLESTSTVDAVLAVDAEGRVTAWNLGAERMFGRRRGEVLGRPVARLLPPQDAALVRRRLAALVAGEGRSLLDAPGELTALRRDGTAFPVEVAISTWEREGRLHVTAVARDVTERRAAEADLARREALDGLVALAARAAGRDRSLEQTVSDVLSEVVDWGGWAGAALTLQAGGERPQRTWTTSGSAPLERALQAADLAAARAAADRTAGGPVRARLLAQGGPVAEPDGRLVALPVWLGHQLAGVLDVHLGQGAALAPDVLEMLRSVALQLGRTAERQVSSELLVHQATHDALTGLVNRARLVVELEEALSDGDDVALLFVDLDRFKVVNDTFGHAVGDEVLRVVAARLQSCVRAPDVLARLGGDEFVVLCRGTRQLAQAQHVAERLLAAVAEPCEVRGRRLHVGASAGIALAEPGLTGDGLLLRADEAMYAAKAAGRGQYAASGGATGGRHGLSLRERSALHVAVERQELRVHYQPVVDLATGCVQSLEALVRWEHDGELLPPGRFVPFAEESALIVPIGAWVLQAACRDLAAWSAQHPELAALGLAVNVSMVQLRDPALVGQVAAALRDSGLPAGRLTLELTESALAADDAVLRAVVSGLAALGVRLVIDDFGTGYACLAYLHRFPVHGLKLDKSFVDRLDEDRGDALAGAVLGVAGALGLTAVAEGVESERDATRLARLGYRSAQGYLFSRPVPGPAVVEVVRARAAAPPPGLGSAPRDAGHDGRSHA